MFYQVAFQSSVVPNMGPHKNLMTLIEIIAYHIIVKRALLYCHRTAKVLPKPEFIGQMEKIATLLLLLKDNFQQNKAK